MRKLPILVIGERTLGRSTLDRKESAMWYDMFLKHGWSYAGLLEPTDDVAEYRTQKMLGRYRLVLRNLLPPDTESAEWDAALAQHVANGLLLSLSDGPPRYAGVVLLGKQVAGTIFTEPMIYGESRLMAETLFLSLPSESEFTGYWDKAIQGGIDHFIETIRPKESYPEAPKSNVTLQINSVTALERLVGGDPDLFLEIRKSALANICDRYVPKVTTDTLNTAIQKVVDKTVAVRRNNDKQIVTLKPPVVDAVRAVIQRELREVVEKEVRKAKKDWLDETNLQKQVEEIYKDAIRREVDAQVRSSVTEIINNLEFVKK